MWILDTLERSSRYLYPSLLFIDRFTEPIPPVDVLLLIKITLPQCRYGFVNSLNIAPSFYFKWLGSSVLEVYHLHVGGTIDASFTVFSISRIHDVVSLTVTTVLHLSAGSLRRIVSAKTSGGRPSAPPLLSQYLDGLYSPCKSLPYFVVPSVFMLSGWSC